MLLAGNMVSGAHAAANPIAGYSNFSAAYSIPYAADSGLTTANGPRINALVAGAALELPVDTGSRAFYASQALVPGIVDPEGPPGFVYLNSSSRIFRGTWSTQTITFPDAVAVGAAPLPAQAVVPVLVVDTLACSTTPSPGQSTASTTFATLVESGTVTLTDGTVVPFSGGVVTLTGGQAVSYAANPGILGSVINFGVGFDRSGQGTSPNNDQHNQQYNAFLNLLPMRTDPPTMRAGFILRRTGIQLGLTATDQGYAYTNLLPTGFAQDPPSPPDWQAPTGTLTYGGTTYPPGQVVIDTGISFGILTLPGLTGPTAPPPLTVNLLNSQGGVSYTINADPENPLNPTSLTVFPPLLGSFSENWGSFRPQFFNTGRRLLNLFDFLYDAVGGYVGLAPNGAPVANAEFSFTLNFYPAPNVPPAPYVVPIFHTDVGGTDHLLLYASVGGGPLVPYLLDSGSPNFFSTYGPWWPGTTPPSANTPPGSASFTFADGTSYTYNVVNTEVALGSPAAGVLASAPNVNVALITNVGDATPLASYTSWQANVANPALGTALADGTFGNFSAGLYGTNSLATVLAQVPLPPGLTPGFIIASGGPNATQGHLTIGLTTADIASFPVRIPMSAAGNLLPGVSGGAGSLPAFLKTQVANSTVTLTANGIPYTAPVGTVFDTGGGEKNVFYQDQSGPQAVPGGLIVGGGTFGQVVSGAAFRLSAPTVGDFYGYTTGPTPAVNEMVVDPDVSGGVRINPGIALFYRYDVMFDLAEGVVGLRPIVNPTPTPTPLPAAPIVAITSRQIAPDRRRVTVRGTARSALGISRVTYQRGARGRVVRATGTERWRFRASLAPGRNVFLIRATDPLPQTTTARLTVRR